MYLHKLVCKVHKGYVNIVKHNLKDTAIHVSYFLLIRFIVKDMNSDGFFETHKVINIDCITEL